MTCTAFQHLLRTTGRYATPADARPAVPVRPGLLADGRFHWGVFRQIVISARAARSGHYDSAAWAQHSFDMLRLVERFGVTATYEGFAPRAALAAPVVYASNHMSTLETALLPSALLSFGPLAVVLKESLLHYPYFGAVCRAIDPIVVSRRHARADLQAVLEQGCAKLAAGTSVLLFPQATRAPVFQAARFNSMAVKLAQAAGAPLVPVAVQTDFMRIGRWIKDLGPVDPTRPVRIACGPVLPSATPARELQRQCIEHIAGQLQAWGLPVEAGRAQVQDRSEA